VEAPWIFTGNNRWKPAAISKEFILKPSEEDLMQTRRDVKNPLFKTTLLSLSLLPIMTGAGVAPGMSRVAEAFPQVGPILLKMVLSAPPLFMVFAALGAGFLSRWIRKQTLLLTGLLLFLAGGVGAGLSDSFGALLLLRSILGIGAGTILPFSTGLIGEFYEDDEKTRMMGYSFAANNIGAITGNLAAGFLAVVSWRVMFHIYWIAIPVIVLVILFLRDLPGPSSVRKKVSPLPPKVYRFPLYAFLLMMLFFAIVTNLSLLIEGRQIGSPGLSGGILALNALCMFLGGVLLSRIRRVLKASLVPVAWMAMAGGFLGMAQVSTAVLLALSVALAGLGLGCLFPYLLNELSNTVTPEQNIRAMSLAMAAGWLGQFLSPVILDPVCSVLGGDPGDLFTAIGCGLVLATLWRTARGIWIAMAARAVSQ
jgi:MFS family permease